MAVNAQEQEAVIVRNGRVKVRIWQSTGENIKNAVSASTRRKY